MSDNYEHWRADLAKPDHNNRDTDQTTDGFWRIHAAKTKADNPVAIWHDDLGVETIKIGRKDPTQDGHEIEDFRAGSWFKCLAVTEADYHTALETGFWPNDGKPSRKMTDEERLGIDTVPGGNAAPIEEAIADQIAALAEKAKNTPKPKTQAEADAATVIVDKLRALWKAADAERDREKRPHDEAAKAVQAKWLPIMEPAKIEGGALDERRKAFLRKEQARLDAEAAAERARLAREAQAERERLAEEARREAEERGEDPADVVVPEVHVAPVEAQRATAGGAYGRNSGLRKVKVGHITDMGAFLAANVENPDIVKVANQIAQRMAKAGAKCAGLEIKEELK